MKPLIKWTGGKSTEIKHFKHLIPDYERYFEPFFGGGALFFFLKPNRAIINDLIPELMTFYKFIKNENLTFKEELTQYATNWENYSVFMDAIISNLVEVYLKFRENTYDFDETKSLIDISFEEHNHLIFKLFTEEFSKNNTQLQEYIRKNVKTRFFNLHTRIDKNGNLNTFEIREQLETALRGGYYTHFREIYNDFKNGKIILTSEKMIANYYFIREFCFGGMFRQNSSGGFNIPYGGINYNRKNFRSKVNHIFSQDVSELFKNTEIECTDFETVLKKYSLTQKDFIFIDPPYDSAFKKYDGKTFKKEDHIRLARTLTNTKADFILIIKNTDFVQQTYCTDSNFSIEPFKKKYATNIKSRFSRDVEHLIISKIS